MNLSESFFFVQLRIVNKKGTFLISTLPGIERVDVFFSGKWFELIFQMHIPNVHDKYILTLIYPLEFNILTQPILSKGRQPHHMPLFQLPWDVRSVACVVRIYI